MVRIKLCFFYPICSDFFWIRTAALGSTMFGPPCIGLRTSVHSATSPYLILFKHWWLSEIILFQWTTYFCLSPCPTSTLLPHIPYCLEEPGPRFSFSLVFLYHPDSQSLAHSRYSEILARWINEHPSLTARISWLCKILRRSLQLSLSKDKSWSSCTPPPAYKHTHSLMLPRSGLCLPLSHLQSQFHVSPPITLEHSPHCITHLAQFLLRPAVSNQDGREKKERRRKSGSSDCLKNIVFTQKEVWLPSFLFCSPELGTDCDSHRELFPVFCQMMCTFPRQRVE